MKYSGIIFGLVTLANAHTKTLDSLTLDQQIGQLFAIAVPLTASPQFLQKTCALINQYHIGSALLDRRGTIAQEAKIINTLISTCTVPPLIMQDFEYGLCMRLYNGVCFPKALTCGAIQDDQLMYQMAQEIGRECKLLNVDINLAPVVDLTSDASSMIKERSFGQDREHVANKALAFVNGLLSQGVYPCLKHFPGHGDCVTDPHLALPAITQTKKVIWERGLYPFRQLITKTPCIMSAHMHVPAYDDRPYYTATLSYPIITKLLKNTLDFKGLVISDALRMQALTNHFDLATIVRESFNAGHDILLCPHPIDQAMEFFKQAVATGAIDQQQVAVRAQKIITAKQALNVYKKTPIAPNIYEQIHSPHAYELKKRLYQAAITLVQNNDSLIPYTITERALYIQIGGTFDSTLFSTLHKTFPEFTANILDSTPTGCDINELFYQFDDADTAIVGLFGVTSNPNTNFGIAPSSIIVINKLNQTKKVILIVFGPPYCVTQFKHLSAIIVAYEDDDDAQEAAAKVITGELVPQGKLPVTVK